MPFSGPKWLISVLALLFLLLALPEVGTPQQFFVLYDDFKSTIIDPSRWYGAGGDPNMLESVRELVPRAGTGGGRRLHLSLRANSATTDNNSSSGGVFGLGFPAPSAITAVEFTAVVNKAQAVGCTGFPSQDSVTGVEFRGRFFNTQTSPASQLGDVEAVIGVSRASEDTGSPLTVNGFYQICADDGCGNRTTPDFRVLGSVLPGTANILEIGWKKDESLFLFCLNGSCVTSTYSVSDSSPPFAPGKTIDVARSVADCTGEPRPYTFVDAFVDNVYVNSGP